MIQNKNKQTNEKQGEEQTGWEGEKRELGRQAGRKNERKKGEREGRGAEIDDGWVG